MPFTNFLPRISASRPRSSTKGPLDTDEWVLCPDSLWCGTKIRNVSAPLTSSLSPQSNRLSTTSQPASPRTSLTHARSPVRASAVTIGAPDSLITSKHFSFLLRPEIYHQLSPLSVPPPFRTPARQPAPETPIPDLLKTGHFRAAAIASVQALTSSPVSATTAAAHPPVNPTDHARIFDLLYTRLACLCLIDAVPLAAQEAKALEDLNSAFYLDPLSGAHLVPWALRILVVRLQTIGFGDPRRAVMSYYELAREARAEIAKARQKRDNPAAELWKHRLAELGVEVAGSLIEMDDLAGAADHLATLGDGNADDGRLSMSRALLWLHLGDVEAARRCVRDGKADGTNERVVCALADMADGEYETALEKWSNLRNDMISNEIHDEMIGVNYAVCMLYTGRMEQGRAILEWMVDAEGCASHTLLFNLTTMYELCTDRAKSLKLKLAERVANQQVSRQDGVHGWEKTNADFKL